ncbi:MAG: hypothetical protein ACU88J_02770, partial [Gammaproteobacteria bacterium]
HHFSSLAATSNSAYFVMLFIKRQYINLMLLSITLYSLDYSELFLSVLLICYVFSNENNELAALKTIFF